MADNANAAAMQLSHFASGGLIMMKPAGQLSMLMEMVFSCCCGHAVLGLDYPSYRRGGIHMEVRFDHMLLEQRTEVGNRGKLNMTKLLYLISRYVLLIAQLYVLLDLLSTLLVDSVH